MKKYVLITGGAGFIGSHVADQFLASTLILRFDALRQILEHRMRTFDIHKGTRFACPSKRRRLYMRQNGVLIGKPVSHFRCIGSPLRRKAHAYYIESYCTYSDLWVQKPVQLPELESRKQT